ncbi:MAG TPA: 6-phosphofructokinase, partial [Pirellulales bacterium]|nr:6-phosphofructokinase [Pirellulales bacterium]
MSTAPLSRSSKTERPIHKAAILFAGGPAPAANAVISTAAVSFLRNGIQVVGVLNGYSHLVEFSKEHPLVAGSDYIPIDHKTLRRTRNSQGIIIGTARTNPGKDVSHPSHLDDPVRSAPLRTVYEALCSLEVDALVSIGGDDTLKTANKFKLFQDRLPAGSRRIPVVHLPKTIDNDYMGIDFTFGYFTAVDTIAGEIRNLLADAEANQAYYLTEAMGRSAGWLAYGAAIAGEASLVMSVEDVHGPYADTEEFIHAKTGEKRNRIVMKVDEVINRIVETMRIREQEGKQYGVIVVAEGLAEFLPADFLKDIPRDDHDHINIAQVGLGRMFAKAVADEYKKQTGRTRKVTGLQLGYEARCAKPNSFDVMLGSQLGVGAYRALVEQRLNGVMVSVSGQLELHYVDFAELVNPETLVTVVRHVDPDSDFHKLVRFLETYVNKEATNREEP